ncbi:hypothetical protein S40285_09516, partial [Stachybotrys chlorohalonatus IBT 40285]
MTKVFQESYCQQVHKQELERQLKGIVVNEEAKLTIIHQLEERNQLQTVLCDFGTNLSIQEVTQRKILAINLM